MEKVDLSKYEHRFSTKNKIARAFWNVTYVFLFRPFGLGLFDSWRNSLLRFFGATIGKSSIVHSSVTIWAPWNLKMGDYACLGPKVDCYNQGKVTIGDHVTISQKSYVCASSHDISDPKNNLILCPIEIKEQVWIAADAFIGPGVTVGEGAVVGARAAVFKDVDAWTVVGGNPAKFIKKRDLHD